MPKKRLELVMSFLTLPGVFTILMAHHQIDADLEARLKENRFISLTFTLLKIRLFIISSNIIIFVYHAYLTTDWEKEFSFN